jgi:hypothetical protein
MTLPLNERKDGAIMSTLPLAANNLFMPPDFPTAAFERTYLRAKLRSASQAPTYDHFNAAWNAIALRFLTLSAEDELFANAISAADSGASFEKRYLQERHLFGFFSNGFATFEAFFYGMFAVGGFLKPAEFPMTTPSEQQRISPNSTESAYRRHFSGVPMLAAMQSVLVDPAYAEWKFVRNVLTHRTAPGRTLYVATSSDLAPAPRWKIGDITLDGTTLVTRRAHAARMLGVLLDAAALFMETLIS